jgi:membrane protease YdiL (CAAX protease family)
MLFAAIASPWVQQLLSPMTSLPLSRIFDRLMLLGMIAVTFWLVRRQHAPACGLLGFHGPSSRFLLRLVAGLFAGLLLMCLALVPLLLLGLRVWSDRLPTALLPLLVLVAKGLGSGLLVAVLEESFFRGALQGSLQGRGGRHWALFAVPFFYSAVHFLGRSTGVPTDAVSAWSGFAVWQGLFATLARPLPILDAFAALYCVGLLLALVRLRWGDLAGCIGLHAGFVTVISVFRRISVPAADNPWSFMVDSFDGLLGMWIAALTAALCIVIWRSRPAAVL